MGGTRKGGGDTHFKDTTGETLCLLRPEPAGPPRAADWLRSVCSPDRWNVAHAPSLPAPRVGHLLPATEVERATTSGPTQTCKHSTIQKTLCYLPVSAIPMKIISSALLPFLCVLFSTAEKSQQIQPRTGVRFLS